LIELFGFLDKVKGSILSSLRTILISFACVSLLLVASESGMKGSVKTHYIDFSCPPEEWAGELVRSVMPVDTPPPNPNLGPGDPTTRPGQNPFAMPNPSNIETVFELDEGGTGYYVYERMNGVNVRPPSHISMKEYMNWRSKNTMRDNWKSRSSGVNTIGTNNPLDFKFATNSEALKDIFGGGSVEIRPNGSALIDIGGEFNRSQNPALPIRQQRTGNLKFDQQIQLNVVGKIGEKLRLNANWDTQATFDFENQLKLQYTGTPNEILQSIEAGNVSLPLKGSLITGGQNLFGIKTAMKFGPVLITSIASQQKGKTQAVTATGGAQVTEFKKRGDDYDYNRHFFLSHYFRSRYEHALKGRPNINSPITITRIEVWITNNNQASTVDNRNAVGFVDLGETDIVPNPGFFDQHGRVWNNTLTQAQSYPANAANSLYASISSLPVFSEKATVDTALVGQFGFQNGTDFIKVENMRKLNSNEYNYHSQLGYVSLNSALQQNQVLFVAFEYRLGDKVYQVGDFTQDPGKVANNLNSNVLFLKMLKPDKIQPRADNRSYPCWDLMMKNVYSIGGYGLSQDNFRLDLIYDSRSSAGDISYLPTGAVKNIPLIQVFGLDTLQNNNQAGHDNFFDYIDRITIIPDKGTIIFPVLEPFGSHLRRKLNNVAEDVDKYVFDTLYGGTQQDAINYATDKNRYFLKGSYQGTSSSEISLNSINVAPGSVKVTANGIQLMEGTDYTVDYTIGKVMILNSGILTSGQELKVTFETNSLYGIETKTMIGSRADITLSKDFQLGATILHMNEKPLTNKITIGDEPTSNVIWGADGLFRRDSKFLTRLIDKLPFLQTNEISNIQMQGEFAQLIPGHPRAIQVNGESGISYLDDFESAKTTFDLMGYKAWSLASYPGNNGHNDMVTPGPGWNAALSEGFNRAKLAWYSIDPSFYYGSTNEIFPETDLSNNYSRQITPNEVFPNQTRITGDNVLRTFDLHYLPEKRGMYNYQADPAEVDSSNNFRHPKDMWAGIQRRTSGNTDFEAANFEFIEFWMMDPFLENQNNGGQFFLNLGAVSEDVLRDNVRNFENGLAGDPADFNTMDTSSWGLYPLTTPPTTSFSNDPAARPNQDVGLDGLSDANERLFFKKYLDTLDVLFPNGGSILSEVAADPSNDDYHYFRGDDLSQVNMGIIKRYLPWNGHEGNTPINSNQNGYSTQGSTTPDTEDLNLNSTLNTSERYWEYKMNFKPSEMQIGKNYIVDVIPAEVSLVGPVDSTVNVNWYQFRIPLQSGKAIGDIQDFKAIEFIRMYMNGWSKEVILRFAKFQLVSTSWRTSRDYMGPESDTLIGDPSNTTFSIGTVNVEENSNRKPFPYKLPPNIVRQNQIASTQAGLLQNEQSLVMKTCGLQDGDGRGAFKLVNYDMRSYKRLKLWVHAENVPGSTQQFHEDQGELRAFIRLGSDIKNNYYEYEIPLNPSEPGATDSLAIWANQFNFELAELAVAKALRNEQGHPTNTRFQLDLDDKPDDPDNPGSGRKGGHRIYVVGTPKTSEIKAMMIGIRNEADGRGPICAEVWVNELRLVDFDENAGWAANARANIKLADFANITISGSYKTPGFGSLEQKINNRSRETTKSIDVAGTFNMGKFFPKNWGIQLPLYLSWGERIVDPKYNPLEADVKMVNYLAEVDSSIRDSVLHSLQDIRINKSISLNNIRKVRVQQQQTGPKNTPPKTHPWDVENLTLSLSYNETFASNYTTLARWQKNHHAALGYAYNFNSKPIEPFKNAKHKNPITLFNFNPLPKTVGVNVVLDRRYEENQMRQSSTQLAIAPTYMKNFSLSRTYNLRWDLTKSLSFNYNATNTGRVDEPIGAITDANRDSIYKGILHFGTVQDRYGIDSLGNDKLINFGRNTRFSQQVGVNYIVPFDKFKPTNWINATLAYQGSYNWLSAPDNALYLGNQINNSSSITANTRLNLENLYNKVGFLKRMLEEQNKGPVPPDKKPTANAPLPKPKPGEQEVKEDTTKEEDSFVFLKAIGKQIVKTLLSVRNVDINYGTNSATALAGYMPNSDNFGLDFNYQYLNPDSSQTIRTNKLAPGLPFVVGWQPDVWRASQVGDTAMLNQFARNGWISNSSTLSTPFTQTWSNQLTGRTSITLFKDFKVDLNVTKNNSVNYSELFHFDDTLGGHVHDNRLSTGQYSVSYIFIGTAFEKNVAYSKSYLELQDEARGIVSSRLATDNPEYNDFLGRAGIANPIVDGQYNQGYYRNSQEVLIPSFLSAYGAGKPGAVGLSAFPAIPLPNWNVNYNGLTKIPSLKKIFTTISIKHAYRGTYTVGGYTSNVRFTGDQESGYTDNFFGVGTVTAGTNTDSVYNIQSQYVIPSVAFSESFAPLAGINVTLKSGLSGSLDLKMNRNVSLSLGNQQLTETKSKDFSFSVSYRKDKLEKTLNLFGRTLNLKNALNSRLEISLRDSKTRNRKLDFEGNSDFTAGNFMLIVKPSVDYVINSKLNLRFYIEHTRNRPAISTSFPSSYTAVGFQVRFTL
jgi:cell surface protein SprA